MENVNHVSGAEMDQLARLIHDLWPKMSDHDKVHLIEGIQGMLSEVLFQNPELQVRCEALRRQYGGRLA